MPSNRGTPGIGQSAPSTTKIPLNRPPARILRLNAVIELVGLRRAALYRMKRAGTFPEPIKLGVRAVGWVEEDVLAWIARRANRPLQAAAAESDTDAARSLSQPAQETSRTTRPLRSQDGQNRDELRRLRAIARRVRRINRLQAEIARLLQQPTGT